MSNRFPPLTAPAPMAITPRRRSYIAALPRWMQSLPLTELFILGSVALILAVA